MKRLDREIDMDMGWVDRLKKEARRRAVPRMLPPSSPRSKSHLPRLPCPASEIRRSRFRQDPLLPPRQPPGAYSKTSRRRRATSPVVKSPPGNGKRTPTPSSHASCSPSVVPRHLPPRRRLRFQHPSPARAGQRHARNARPLYKRVRLVTVDAQALTAWYVPAMTADEMAFDPDASLAQKWPAVVLLPRPGLLP